jgi:hypothetical protein
MAELSAQFLRSLIEAFPHPLTAKVVEALPPELSARFGSQSQKVHPKAFLCVPSKILRTIHPSWHEEIAACCPGILRPVFTKCMLHEMQQPVTESVPPPAVKEFVLGACLSAWPDSTVPGVEFIEQTQFSALLQASIDVVISLLAVFEIAADVRKIVEKKVLLQLWARLSPLQQRFLRSLHAPSLSPRISVKEFLQRSDEEASQLLFHTGAERLGWALCGEPPIFLWHLFHRMERAHALEIRAALENTPKNEENAAKKQLVLVQQFLQRTQ